MVDKRRIVFYPVSKGAALAIVRAFYNGNEDPFNLIGSAHMTDGQTRSTILATYYLSCLRYFTHIEFNGFSSELFQAACGPQDLYRTDPEKKMLKETDKKVDANIVIFHALYGGYAICRGTKNKSSLKVWCRTRFNALMSTIECQTNNTINLDLRESGKELYQLASEIHILRKIIHKVIASVDEISDSVGIGISQHLRVLTSYTGMTPYTFALKALSQGGAALNIPLVAKQLHKLEEDKKGAIKKLLDDGYSAEDLPFIHLIYDNYKCFRASDICDLMVIGQAIEILKDKTSKAHLQSYISKANKKATLNIKQMMQLLQCQPPPIPTIADIPADQKKLIEETFGMPIEDLMEEAKKIVEILKRQKANAIPHRNL